MSERSIQAEERRKRAENREKIRETLNTTAKRISSSIIENENTASTIEPDLESEENSFRNSWQLNYSPVKHTSSGEKSQLPWGKIIPFSGENEEDIDDWLEQFETFANAFNWTDREKTTRIIFSMKGKAGRLINQLKREDKEDYEIIKEKLIESFRHQKGSDWARELRRVQQKQNETVSLFATRVEYMARKAGYEEDSKIILHSFIDGLDSVIRGWVILQKPENMSAALKAAKDKEESLRHEGRNEGFILEMVNSIHHTQIEDQQLTQKLQAQLIEIKEENRELREQLQRMRANQKPAPPIAVKGQIKCFYCQKLGHTKSQCWSFNPKLKPKQSGKHPPAKVAEKQTN